MKTSAKIHHRLKDAFAPEQLEVINESHLHTGHAGDDGSGESHFRIVIQADVFASMTRIARHRAVHSAMGSELVAKIHALSLDIS